MRRIFNFLFGVVALGFVAFAAYSYFTEKIVAPPLSIETVDGRPFINVTQPQTVTWSGPLDNSGYDVSHPQCSSQLPSKAVGFVIVGLNKGKPFSENPCFEKQWAWAKTHQAAAVYINTADPGDSDPNAYGQKIATDTLSRLEKFGVPKTVPVWLDVELHNTWTETSRSVSVITEAMHLISSAGYHVGIYSTTAHWMEITMNAKLGVPTWRALGEYSDVQAGVADALAACQQSGIAGTKPAIVQFMATVDGVSLDRNILCGDANGIVGSPN